MTIVRKIIDIGARRQQPPYYEVIQKNGKIAIPKPSRVPLGMTLLVQKAWDRLSSGSRLRQGMAMNLVSSEQIINTSGRGMIDPNTRRFTLDGAPQKPFLDREPMPGRVLFYDESGREVPAEGFDVLLPGLQKEMILSRVDRLGATIEIVPHPTDPTKLVGIERRMATTGLPADKSKVPYRLTKDAARRIEEEVIDLEWITDVKIVKVGGQYKCKITFEHPVENSVRATSVIELDGDCFVDNDGKPLLQNAKRHLGKLNDIYQSDFYTEETADFRPVIDRYPCGGALHLVVNRVKRYEIDRPAELAIPAGRAFKIFPTAADAAVKVGGEWIPVALREPLNNLSSIDPNLSQIVEGIIQHAIGPQVKLGEGDNFSGDYPRDIYFYGTAILATLSVLENWGENFSINRGKAIRAFGAIHSGRTHCMNLDMIYNAFADLMDTNNAFYVKVSNYAEEFNPPGVSEDAQMEIGSNRLRGVRMWMVNQMIALMKAEKKHGEFFTQNADRYIYSETLFVLSMALAKTDILEGRFLGWRGGSNVLFSWADMAEKFAGRTWYKWAFKKNVEASAIPVYLSTLGYIAWYPVDLTLFAFAWSLRTLASANNYIQHLHSLGLKAIVTGFWRNPAYELTFLAGYTRGALTQFLYRNQYGSFSRTAEAGRRAVSDNCVKLVSRFAASTVVALGLAGISAGMGGLALWLALPFGVAGLITGFSLLARGLAQKGGKRIMGVAAGAALAATGAVLAVGGAPVLATSSLSIAFIANVGFGIYSFGMLIKSLAEMRKAIKYAETPVCQVFIRDNKLWRGVRIEIEGEDKKALKQKVLEFIAAHDGKYKYDPAVNYFMVSGEMTHAEETELKSQGIFPKGCASFAGQTRQAVPLQGLNSEAELIACNARFKAAKSAAAALSFKDENLHQTLAAMEKHKRTIKDGLIALQVMDSDNRTHQGFTHPYRILSMQMLDLYNELEVKICNLTAQILEKDTSDPIARQAFMRLMRETRNYTVVNLGRIMVRTFDLRLGGKPK